MAVVTLIFDLKDQAYLEANPTKVLEEREPIFINDGRYAFGDGESTLAELTFFGGGSPEWGNIAGTITNQTDLVTYVAAAIAGLVAGAPSGLNNLFKLAAAINNDPNFFSTIATALGLKAPIASPTFTGTVTAPVVATPKIESPAGTDRLEFAGGFNFMDGLLRLRNTGNGNTTYFSHCSPGQMVVLQASATQASASIELYAVDGSGDGKIDFSTRPTPVYAMRMFNDKVRVGDNTTPTANLDVFGNVKVSTLIAGTNYAMIMSDTSGILTKYNDVFYDPLAGGGLQKELMISQYIAVGNYNGTHSYVQSRNGTILQLGNGSCFAQFQGGNFTANISGGIFTALCDEFRIQTRMFVGDNTTTPLARVDVAASTTTLPHIILRPGVAPTSPPDGSIWYDGTDLFFRQGGVTNKFTLTPA